MSVPKVKVAKHSKKKTPVKVNKTVSTFATLLIGIHQGGFPLTMKIFKLECIYIFSLIPLSKVHSYLNYFCTGKGILFSEKQVSRICNYS